MSGLIDSVWVFNGAEGRFSSGVFTSLDKAEEWIRKHKLAGILTEYPLDEGVYDWAIQNNFFEIKKDDQKGPAFIQGFTSANQDHFHYENGEKE